MGITPGGTVGKIPPTFIETRAWGGYPPPDCTAKGDETHREPCNRALFQPVGLGRFG